MFRSTRLIADKFRAITRWGDLGKVLAGIDAAQAAGLKVKINAVALKGVNEDEIAALLALGAWPRHGSHGDRGDAAWRCRRRPARPVPAAIDGAGAARRALHAGRHRLSNRRAGALCPRQGNRRTARLHHADDPQFLRSPAIACASPAPARSICASARTMPPICARRCAPPKATICSMPRSTRPSRASPKGHDFVIDRRHRRPALSRHMSVTGG